MNYFESFHWDFEGENYLLHCHFSDIQTNYSNYSSECLTVILVLYVFVLYFKFIFKFSCVKNLALSHFNKWYKITHFRIISISFYSSKVQIKQLLFKFKTNLQTNWFQVYFTFPNSTLILIYTKINLLFYNHHSFNFNNLNYLKHDAHSIQSK